jgi:hypothetical protein
VIIHLRSLANTNLGRVLGPQELLERFFALAEMLPPREKAFYSNKIAEAYLALGRADLAGDYFTKGAKSAGRIKAGSRQKAC